MCSALDVCSSRGIFMTDDVRPAKPMPRVRLTMVSIAPRVGAPTTKITNLESREDVATIEKARRDNTPLWVEFDLVGDTSWFEPKLEPWDKLERPKIDWTLAAGILDLLGVD